MTKDRDEFRRRAVRAALAVAGIAAAIGLVIGLLVAGVVHLSGVGLHEKPERTVAVPRADAEEEIPTPVLSPTASPSPTTSSSPPTSSATSPATPSATSSPSPPAASSRPGSPSASPSASAADARHGRSKQTSRPTRGSARKARAIRLHAGSVRAGRYERVVLRGGYAGGNGRTLAVQRFEGGAWRPFPTSATVRGGTFSTYVASGRPGPNRFRMVDRATGRASNVVVVRVG